MVRGNSERSPETSRLNTSHVEPLGSVGEGGRGLSICIRAPSLVPRLDHLSKILPARVQHILMYSHSVFTEIALTKPQGDLIPNLRNLACSPYSLCDFIPFTSQPTSRRSDYWSFTGMILPKLQIFEYEYTERSLDVLLNPLSSLTELEIAPATLTSCVMHALACLPDLEHIRSTHRWPTRTTNQLPHPPVDTSERFTSLRVLETSANSTTYANSCSSQMPSRPENLRFSEIISSCYPQLGALHLGIAAAVMDAPRRYRWPHGIYLRRSAASVV
ncbi:hypothetical protein BDN71DRAFT_806780 [Pleurotus eryngii]|uniref:Uncharacterized protein n=1 Tax=Pleurotus eryngii TaxID=5323 RepID=A0A9P6DH23_PLEER|nr:hypothetical protein BDN71DRAFT_806780 [Pleurotus eryngii]